MIQILALREFYSEKTRKNIKAEVWFERGMRAPSVEAIFADPESFIAKATTASERFNLYYTVSECIEEKGRKLLIQHHIPFDVDGLDIPFEADGVTPDKVQLELIAKVVCGALGVDFNDIGVLFSGNGLQFLVGTTLPIQDVAYFDAQRHHYGAICDRIDLHLIKAKLKGKADRSVWSPARLMRYPNTENQKKDKPTRKGFILNAKFTRLNFDIKIASGIPDVPNNQQVAKSLADSFPTPDAKTILQECKFLAWAQTNPEKVSEPEWYAAVSVTARFQEGRKFTHKMSEGHPGYNYAETDLKISQALEASGPRTCKNINNISGGKCENFKCKHFGTKLASPVMIEGPDHVKSEKHGFHNVFVDSEGNVKKGKPDYLGLQKFFQKEHRYISIEVARTIWSFTGTHYKELSHDRVKQYAQQKFDPAPDTAKRNEFLETVRMYNMREVDWFTKSIEGKMNFQNGILDVQSGVLLDHSMEYGFRSVLPCSYSKEADCPRFMRFMDEVTLGRQGLKDVIQEYLGYIFANGSCKYEKMLVLLGSGANGKSTLVDLVRTLAGEGGSASLSVKAMYNEQNRAMLEGTLVNIAEENSRDSFKDTEFLKNMISGGMIQVKRLYTQPYEFRARTKLIALCNEAPYSFDNSHGFYRKLLLIPFDAKFSDDDGTKDVNIKEKLQAELPGIFNWIMEGYRRLDKQGKFTKASEIESLLEKYKEDTDSIAAWIKDYIVFEEDANYELNRNELYADYVAYCDQHGIKAHISRRVFDSLREFVKDRGKTIEERKRQKDSVRVWTFNHLKHLAIAKF